MKFFFISIFFLLTILCNGDEIKFYEKKITQLKDVVQIEISPDFNNDKQIDKVLYLQRNNIYNRPNYLYIYIKCADNKYKKIVKKIDNVQNQYYSGYGINISKDNKLILSFSYPNERGIDVQKYYFTFEFRNEKFLLIKTEYENLNDKCDGEIFENYSFTAPFLKKITLDSFDAIALYERLEKLKNNSKYFKKLIPSSIMKQYKETLILHEDNNISELKLYIENNIIQFPRGQDTNESCHPEDYLNNYLFLDKSFDVSVSNGFALFFEETDHNPEAIYLLEKIIEKFTDRTVAYLNLGDAYYGLGDKTKAIKSYQTYIDQMKKKGWEIKIPKRVLDRIQEAQ